jgi:hypothetical protein
MVPSGCLHSLRGLLLRPDLWSHLRLEIAQLLHEVSRQRLQ